MFFYRGYAYSDKAKTITEDAIKIDAQAMLDWTYDNFALLGDNRYLMGKSFGAAVATYTATELSTRDCEPAREVFKGLILEAGFTSAYDAIKNKINVPSFLFNQVKWRSIDRISNLQIPGLIIVGTADDTCPQWMSKALHEKKPDGTKLVTIQGGGHRGLHKLSDYFPALQKFLKYD